MKTNSITVHLHDADKPVKSITVHPSDSLRILDDQITSKGQRVLYCNGSILMPAFSFNFLNVQDGDHVFVVRPKETNFNNDQNLQKQRMKPDLHTSFQMSKKLKRMTDNTRNHNKTLKMLGGTSILHEASRLADLSKIQLDSNLLTQYYNLQQRSEDYIQKEKPKEVSQIILQPPTSPSSEALPLLWGLM